MSYILGIESSCDETAAAIYCTEKKRILSSELFSQVEIHAEYGGVVPEIASRSHLTKIRPIVVETCKKAGITLDQLSAVAVTNKPGLGGALLVGFSFAKGLAWALNIPLIPINHLEGHIFSSFLLPDGNTRTDIPFPHLAFSASGGHTALYIVEDFGRYREIGNTLDDASGEAFDKIAKLIGLSYPGGPIIEKLAEQADFTEYFKYPRTRQKPGLYNFSFSGLKTAVMYDLVRRGWYSLETGINKKTVTPEVQKHVASSLLVCIADIFKITVKRVLTDFPELKALSFVGGVACNKYIREKLSLLSKNKKKLFVHSAPRFSTDNGAMIAFVGAYKLAQRKTAPHLYTDIFE